MNGDLPPTPRAEIEAKVTALLLGELTADEAALMRQVIAADPELARLEKRLGETLSLVRETAARPIGETPAQPAPLKLSPERREKLLAHFKTIRPVEFAQPKRPQVSLVVALAAVASIAILASMLLPALAKAKQKSLRVSVANNLQQLDMAKALWAEEEHKPADAVPTAEDLQPYLGGRDNLPSLGGESYAIGPVGKASVAVLNGKTITAGGQGANLAYNSMASSAAPEVQTPAKLDTLRDRRLAENKPAETPPVSQIVLPQGASEQLADADSQNSYKSVPSSGRTLGLRLGQQEDKAQVPAVLAQSLAPPADRGGNRSYGWSYGYGGPDKLKDGASQDAPPAATPPPVSASDVVSGNGIASYYFVGNLTNSAGPLLGDMPAMGRLFRSGAGDEIAKSESTVQAVEKRTDQMASGRTDTTVSGVNLANPQYIGVLGGTAPVAPGALAALVEPPMAAPSLALPGGGARAPSPAHAGEGMVRSKDVAIGFRAQLEGSIAGEPATAPSGSLPPAEMPASPPVATLSPVPPPSPEAEPVKSEAVQLHYAKAADVAAALSALGAQGGAAVGNASRELAEAGAPVAATAGGAGGGGGLPGRPSREAGRLYSPATKTPAPVPAPATEGPFSINAVGYIDVHPEGKQLTAEPTPAAGSAPAGKSAIQVDPGNTHGLVLPPEDSKSVPRDAGKLEDRKEGLGVSTASPATPAKTGGQLAANDREMELEKWRAPRPAQKAAAATDVPLARPAPAALTPQPEVLTRQNAFTTFSLNISDVAFKLAQASLQNGQMPDPASMRSEEFINAFDYRDPEPAAGAPIGFAWERGGDPFVQNRDFVRFAIKTAAQGRQAGRALNLVLLLDKSGSMERADRVEIIANALRVLATQLQPRDTLSVVVFARTPRLFADGVPGSQAAAVARDLRALVPEGGTDLEQAMRLAYDTAVRHYLANGENRVVLLTDGAANLGNVDPKALKQKVEANRKQGIALDCFGVGWDGYNDDLLETLSRAGNGRYGFINTPEEAATEFAGKLAGALRVAAADVKVQVEFNPDRVIAYRQIGYAKDQLKKEEFRDNSVKAAQIGAAEAGNALYTVQINPAGEGPLGVVHVRFRVPGTQEYQEHEWTLPYTGSSVPLDQASSAMRLTATAATFSEWLAGSPFAGDVSPDRLLQYLRGVPQVYGADVRPAQLEWMIRQAKNITGK